MSDSYQRSPVISYRCWWMLSLNKRGHRMRSAWLADLTMLLRYPNNKSDGLHENNKTGKSQPLCGNSCEQDDMFVPDRLQTSDCSQDPYYTDVTPTNYAYRIWKPPSNRSHATVCEILPKKLTVW